MTRSWRWSCWTLVCAALLVVSCKGEDPKAKKPLPLVGTMKVVPKTLERTVDLTGTVEATRIAKVASPAEGPVLSALVREGDQVKAGQVLVAIGRQSEAIAAVASARESLTLEERNLERVERLVAIGAAAREEVDRAKLAVTQAKAKLAAERQGSSDHQIRAPWTGTVSRILISDGAFVAPRETLVEMFDPASLVIRVALPENQTTRVDQDAIARVSLDARPDETFEGTVSRLYPELDRRTRTRTAEVSLPDPKLLAPGMFARVRIVTESVTGALVVPEEALLGTRPEDQAVFVLEDGKAKRRKVRTGLEEGGVVQILEGIRAGDDVIVRGQDGLKDGAPVRTGSGKPAKSSEPPGVQSGPKATPPTPATAVPSASVEAKP